MEEDMQILQKYPNVSKDELEKIQSSYDEMSPQGSSKEDSDDEQMIESCISEVATNPLRRSWFIRPHHIMPYSSPAVEIFSVFIGREQFKAFQVYGSIEVLFGACMFHIFKREAKDAFGLLQDSNTIPVLDGPRAYDDCDSWEMKLDLKDVESRLHIRGYLHWDWRSLDIGSQWLDKHICSVVQGQYDFVAVHYAIFSDTVQANVGFFCTRKENDEHHVDVYPKLYGSLVAHYDNYDYNNKDYLGILLFQRNQEDPAQPEPEADGLIALSRSMVVVPLKSPLVIEANLQNDVSDQVLRASNNHMTMEGNGYSIDIYVKWVEVSK